MFDCEWVVVVGCHWWAESLDTPGSPPPIQEPVLAAAAVAQYQLLLFPIFVHLLLILASSKSAPWTHSQGLEISERGEGDSIVGPQPVLSHSCSSCLLSL